MGVLYVDNVNLETEFGVVLSDAENSFVGASRDIEIVSVPGRNGDITIDKGKWNNVTIPYPCYISSDFQNKFNRLKAFLLSRTGYVRIENSYDTEHFREGVLMAEIIPTTTPLNRGGSFELVFSCKPQRWLKSGEEIIVCDNREGSEAVRIRPVNPTLFESYPIWYVTPAEPLTQSKEAFRLRNTRYERVVLNSFAQNYRYLIDTVEKNCYMTGGEEGQEYDILIQNGVPDIVNNIVDEMTAIYLYANRYTIIDVQPGFMLEIRPRWYEL